MYNQIAVETTKLFQQPVVSKSRGIGRIQLTDADVQHGIELQYIIFNFIQCLENILLVEHGRVREHGNLGFREKAVTGFDRIVDDTGKFRMRRPAGYLSDGAPHQ